MKPIAQHLTALNRWALLPSGDSWGPGTTGERFGSVLPNGAVNWVRLSSSLSSGWDSRGSRDQGKALEVGRRC